MIELEQAVNDANDAFRLEILLAAEAIATTAIQSAFATARRQIADQRATRARLAAHRRSRLAMNGLQYLRTPACRI